MIGIFIPIYLLTIGFSLTQVLVLFLVEWTVFGLFAPLYALIISKVGLKEIIILRTVLLPVLLFLLHLLKYNEFLQKYVYLIVIPLAITAALHTMSIQSLFGKHMGTKKHGTKTAKLVALPGLFSILAPVIGGLVAGIFGFGALFFLASVMLIVSLIPILVFKENVDHPSFNFLVFHKLKKYVKEMFMIGVIGFSGFVFMGILPIALYLTIGDVSSLGLLFGLFSLVSALLIIFTGKLSDKIGIRKVFRIGVLGVGLVLCLMGYYFGTMIFVGLAIVSGFFAPFRGVPFETHLYNVARKNKSVLEFLAFKEFSFFIGRALFLVVIILLGSRLDLAYYIGGISSLLLFVF
ncbi:MFS transporter [Candidatus Woesearchaeota archaeon]|nr:MFS transporter [Candidatus Woesearchaeota archaeon]MBT6044910.1 MFS transporter [Candidatus Woesearchaeota archaeon]